MPRNADPANAKRAAVVHLIREKDTGNLNERIFKILRESYPAFCEEFQRQENIGASAPELMTAAVLLSVNALSTAMSEVFKPEAQRKNIGVVMHQLRAALDLAFPDPQAPPTSDKIQ